MTRLIVLFAALSWLMAPNAHAADRTGVIDARGTRVVVPLPEGYVQASVDMPEWVEAGQALVAPGVTVEDIMVDADCVPDALGPSCGSSYEVMSLPATMTPMQWREVRAQVIEQLGGDTRELQQAVIEGARERLQDFDDGVKFTRAPTSRVVLVALDDPRSVRFYVPAPASLEIRGVEMDQLRVVAQFVVDGQFMMVAVSREFPAGQGTPEAHLGLVEELDAFMTRLYALNPSLAMPAKQASPR